MITINKALPEDVDGIVRIHFAAFKDFFLSSLGRRFLKLYYSSFLRSNKGVVFSAKKDGEIVGFSACSYVSRGFNSSLIKSNLLGFGFEAITLLFTNPKAILRLTKNMNKESDVVKDNGEYAELYSIAVSPNCQGEGVGRKLLTITEEEVKEHNKQVSLTTDYFNNEKTINFYKALGYKEYYQFVTYPNRKMYRLIKKL